MYGYNVPSLERLIEQFERLPGIGHKSAERLAYYMLSLPVSEAEKFANTVVEDKKKIHFCKVCCNFTDKDICPVCSDENRDRSIIIVVKEPKDVVAIERTREFHVTYHVLHGLISPMNGISPANLHIKELLARLNNNTVKEVVMATGPTVEGDATGMYLNKLIHPLGIKVTRLGLGLPVGAELQYADEVTIARSIRNRCSYDGG